jgi:hypothetical protein
VSTIGERIVELHAALEAAGLPHAFGGALALAWCTADPRGTSDIDLNVFVAPEAASRVVGSLPAGVTAGDRELGSLRRDGQARLWWGEVPVDLFLSTTGFHDEAAERVRIEPFLGVAVPFLACDDLAVFKVFFDRTRDWADLEDVAAAGTVEYTSLRSTVARLLGEADERLVRLDALPWRRAAPS